jgi:sorting nexin-1/2
MENNFRRGRFYSTEKVLENQRFKTLIKKRNFTPDRESKLKDFENEYDSESDITGLNHNFQNEKKENYEDRILTENTRNLKSAKSKFFSKNKLHDDEDNSIIFQSDYSFISTYIKFKQNKIPDKLKFDFQVKISNYIIKESDLNIFSHVKYTLEGYLDGREFSVERRYKEFLAYRKLLLKNWPGVFIPPIPPKKDLGNLEESFIKLRKKFLQQFFNRIAAAPHLSSSHETKVFLESKNKNYMDILFEIYFKNNQSIYDYYTQYFEFLIERDLNKLNKNIIHEFYSKLNKTKKQLEDIVFITTESINLKLENDRTTFEFYEYFYDFDNIYVYDMFKVEKETRKKYNEDLIECGLIENLYRRNYKNSFETFYDWSNSELMDINAMIECISSVYKYQELFDKKFGLLNTQNEELNKISNPGFLDKFLFTNDLKYIESKTVEVKNLKEEVLMLKQLLELLYKILYYIEIPTFKRDRTEFYKKFLCRLLENENNHHSKNLEIFKFLLEHGKNILDTYSTVQ